MIRNKDIILCQKKGEPKLEEQKCIAAYLDKIAEKQKELLPHDELL
ncbi:MAG: hypothetical protein ACUVUQ_07060 [Thermodesulfovibrionales bacterium]